jgi:very-short-patch-repair endonuclease
MKRLVLKDDAIDTARRLRRDSTKHERILWNALRASLPHAKFRRQVPLGPYVADFCCHSARLIIELDGGQHAEAVDYDGARTRFLVAEGYRVIRFWNNDITEAFDGVILAIDAAVSKLSR